VSSKLQASNCNFVDLQFDDSRYRDCFLPDLELELYRQFGEKSEFIEIFDSLCCLLAGINRKLKIGHVVF